MTRGIKDMLLRFSHYNSKNGNALGEPVFPKVLLTNLSGCATCVLSNMTVPNFPAPHRHNVKLADVC